MAAKKKTASSKSTPATSPETTSTTAETPVAPTGIAKDKILEDLRYAWSRATFLIAHANGDADAVATSPHVALAALTGQDGRDQTRGLAKEALTAVGLPRSEAGRAYKHDLGVIGVKVCNAVRKNAAALGLEAEFPDTPKLTARPSTPAATPKKRRSTKKPDKTAVRKERTSTPASMLMTGVGPVIADGTSLTSNNQSADRKMAIDGAVAMLRLAGLDVGRLETKDGSAVIMVS